MKLTILSDDKQIIDCIKEYHKDPHKKYQDIFELAAYDTAFLPDESAMLKMHDDIEKSDICILDISKDTEYPLIFNIVYACIGCKGYIISSDFKSSIRDFLRLGMLTIKDIISINPQVDKDANYLSMVRTVQSIEGHGNAVMGKFKDFRNYILICNYIRAGDVESMNKLMSLLIQEYRRVFCSKRYIS